MGEVELITSFQLRVPQPSIIIRDEHSPILLPGDSFNVSGVSFHELDKIHSELRSRPSSGLVGFGGFNAVNAAKALSVKRLKKGGIKQALFESPAPSRPLMLIPVAPAFCTDITSLTVVYDPDVPVYCVLFIEPERVIVPIDVYKTRFEEMRDSLRDLSPTLEGSTFEEYLLFCRSRAPAGLSVEFILSLTIAALGNTGISEALRCVASASRGEACADAKVAEKVALLVRRKIDHLVEHSWSFYMRFLVHWGVESRRELYSLYSTLFSR